MGKKLEREKRLEQEAVRHWEEISLGDFMYDRWVHEKENLVGFSVCCLYAPVGNNACLGLVSDGVVLFACGVLRCCRYVRSTTKPHTRTYTNYPQAAAGGGGAQDADQGGRDELLRDLRPVRKTIQSSVCHSTSTCVVL